MKSHDIDNFIEQNVKNFDISTGWVGLVKQMLFEFCIAGRNLEDGVCGKHKWAELRCYPVLGGVEFSTSIKAIVEYYSKLSAKTCERCGESGKVRGGGGSWLTVLCFRHYMEGISVLKANDLLFFRRGETFDLQTCSHIEFESDYEVAKFYKNHGSGNITLYCTVSERPDYYKLLRYLPKNLLTEEQSEYLDSFFAGLVACDICGHIAVHQGTCKYCCTDSWELETSKELYADKTDYIRESQMYNYIDEYDTLKEMESDTSFEKSPTHEILFTYEELEGYRNSLSEND
jgi:hypothetical protein